MSLVKRTNENWLPSIFDDMFKTDWLGGTTNVNSIGVSIPAVNIIEKDSGFEKLRLKKKEDSPDASLAIALLNVPLAYQIQ